ncbi:hypothetical protein ACJX0J_014694, partial [Zea mays]
SVAHLRILFLLYQSCKDVLPRASEIYTPAIFLGIGVVGVVDVVRPSDYSFDGYDIDGTEHISRRVDTLPTEGEFGGGVFGVCRLVMRLPNILWILEGLEIPKARKINKKEGA